VDRVESNNSTQTVSGGSNFVDFNVGLSSVDGNTVVVLEAERQSFSTGADNANATAVAASLSTTFDQVLDATAQGQTFNSPEADREFADLVFALDNQLSMQQASEVFDDLASGDFYGSLTAISTTAPFTGARDAARVERSDDRYSVWASASSGFVNLNGDGAQGSRDVESNRFGMTAGIALNTERSEFGLGAGLSEVEADSLSDNVRTGTVGRANADSWIVGGYAEHQIGSIDLGATLAYAQSEWDVTRDLNSQGQTASAQFDSSELRGELSASYTFEFDNSWIRPFASLQVRQFSFDEVTETGAGIANLALDEAENSVFTQTLGARAGSVYSVGALTLRPELEMSYTFPGENDAFRDGATTFAPENGFRLEGVDAEGFMTMGGGLSADLGQLSDLFVRASLSPGRNYEEGRISGGLRIRF